MRSGQISNFLNSSFENYDNFQNLGAKTINEIEILNSDEILNFFTRQEEAIRDKKQQFCNGLKSGIIDFARGFTNDDDEKKRERINKITNSLKLVRDLGHDLTQEEKKNLSQAIGENYHKIHNLLDDSFKQSILDQDSLDHGIYRAFNKELISKVEIMPMIDLFSKKLTKFQEIDPNLKGRFTNMIAKSLVKAQKFDIDLFNELRSNSIIDQDILMKGFQGALIEKFQSQSFDIDNVLNIYDTLTIHSSSKKDKEDTELNRIMIRNLLAYQFKINGKIDESIITKMSLNDEFKSIIASELLPFLLEKDASIESTAKLDLLRKLNPDFDSENPDFIEKFYSKIGKEFNPYSQKSKFGLEDSFIDSINKNPKLAGYFFEGLSNILLTKFEKNQDNLSDLKNRLELFKLLNEGPNESNPLEKKELAIFKDALQSKNDFTLGSTLKIGDNLKEFNKKFASDFVSFLTGLKNPNESEKENINNFVKYIISSKNADLLKNILDLLEKNIEKDGKTNIPKGINVTKAIKDHNAKSFVNNLTGIISDEDAKRKLGDDIIQEGDKYFLTKILDLLKSNKPLNYQEDIVETKIKNHFKEKERVVNPASTEESAVDSPGIVDSVCSGLFSCIRHSERKIDHQNTDSKSTNTATALPAQQVMRVDAVIVSSPADIAIVNG